MEIVTLNKKHALDAAKLAAAQYNAEREKVTILPDMADLELLAGSISKLCENGLGIAAIDGGHLVGYMAGYGPLKNYFGNSDGIFSPIEGNAAISENKAKIYTLLYQNTAEVWVRHGLLSHVIAVHSHNDEAVSCLFHLGFGIRCVDAIRPAQSIDSKTLKGYEFRECTSSDADILAVFENKIMLHLRTSPIFMPRKADITAAEIIKSMDDGERYFMVSHEDTPAGFIKIGGEGENFACAAPDMENLCGAYLLPEYRSSGIFTGFLSYVCQKIKAEGYIRLGVDYESFNPQGNAFWQKHFTPYTYSMARRIDERILKLYK